MSLWVKTIAGILIAGAVAAGGYAYYEKTYAPCASPITYKIGQFDTRFGVSQAQFLAAMNEAANVWNKAAGKTVLEYSSNGTLPVNLIYDDREATTQETQTLETTINSGKETADSVKGEYTNLKAQYESDEAAYASAVDAYNQALDSYNQEVTYWNQQGGAPEAEFQKLGSEKTELASERSTLESKRTAINSEADAVNALIDKYNLLVDHVNANVAEVNQSAGREFEEGEYVSDSSGKRINIYEFENEDKLVRVLAHEFGHSLGLQHNPDPQSIMYYLNDSTNIIPSPEDLAALKAACNLK